MVELPPKRTPIEQVDPNILPFFLLSLREREVIMRKANGLSTQEIATELGVSQYTIAAQTGSISDLGLRRPENEVGEKNTRSICLALIQDGVRNGYIDISLPSGIRALTRSESEVIYQISQGLSHEEISQKLKKAEGTVSVQMGSILRKLHARNPYHAVGIMTQLQVNGEYPNMVKR